ncbi:hypothetical protein [Thalassotalea sediminis]|uniref:hypothetical protein n=1 Tax=Thalassotalea sediminis TaxID=1759089 RepID=UPI002573BFEB|nr:hypothetical protein [Thalassotalea sediminis]
MLINTIILFIRDILPIGILIAWLTAFVMPGRVDSAFLIKYCFTSGILMLIIFLLAPEISPYFQGAGFEYLIVALMCSYFLLFTLGSAMSHVIKEEITVHLILVAASIFTAVKGVSFLIYFSGYLSSSNNEVAIYMAVFLACGIIISFSVLLYFFLHRLACGKNQFIPMILWGMFISGQLALIVPLLSQVDVLSEGNILWNSEFFIKDSSEYGHIAKALIGYEATPSSRFIMVYLSGLACYAGTLFGVITFYSVSEKRGEQNHVN